MFSETFMALILSLTVFFSSGSCLALTLDQLKRVEKISETHEIDRPEVVKAIEWLEGLCKENPKDDEAFAQLARVGFFYAVDHDDKSERIKLYQKSIDAADKALELNSKNITANFWKAASIGKQGLDIGITKAFKNAPEMKKHLEVVLSIDEKFEHAGAHRAMGRLYYELPGWPFSFGNFKKAREEMKKAMELSPEHLGNQAYYAQAELKDSGNKDLVRPYVEKVLAAKVDPNHKREQEEYRQVALGLKKKL
jgi:tetratricopeptide (TPR) repeat protein